MTATQSAAPKARKSKWTAAERLAAIHPLLNVPRTKEALATRAAETGVSLRLLRRWLFECEASALRGDDPVRPQAAPGPAAVTCIDAARAPEMLTQDFLADLWLQKRRAEIEAKRYGEMLDFAAEAVNSGAAIEPGLHSLRFVEITRKGKKFLRAVVG